MMDIDRLSLGWQVWLTPRWTRIIRDSLVSYTPVTEEDRVQHVRLFDLFNNGLKEVSLCDLSDSGKKEA